MRTGGYSQASSQVELERSSALHAKEAAQKEKARIERETNGAEKRLLEFRHVKVEELLASMTVMRVQKSGAI